MMAAIFKKSTKIREIAQQTYDFQRRSYQFRDPISGDASSTMYLTFASEKIDYLL